MTSPMEPASLSAGMITTVFTFHSFSVSEPELRLSVVEPAGAFSAGSAPGGAGTSFWLEVFESADSLIRSSFDVLFNVAWTSVVNLTA